MYIVGGWGLLTCIWDARKKKTKNKDCILSCMQKSCQNGYHKKRNKKKKDNWSWKKKKKKTNKKTKPKLKIAAPTLSQERMLQGVERNGKQESSTELSDGLTHFNWDFVPQNILGFTWPIGFIFATALLFRPLSHAQGMPWTWLPVVPKNAAIKRQIIARRKILEKGTSIHICNYCNSLEGESHWQAICLSQSQQWELKLKTKPKSSAKQMLCHTCCLNAWSRKKMSMMEAQATQTWSSGFRDFVLHCHK